MTALSGHVWSAWALMQVVRGDASVSKALNARQERMGAPQRLRHGGDLADGVGI